MAQTLRWQSLTQLLLTHAVNRRHLAVLLVKLLVGNNQVLLFGDGGHGQFKLDRRAGAAFGLLAQLLPRQTGGAQIVIQRGALVGQLLLQLLHQAIQLALHHAGGNVHFHAADDLRNRKAVIVNMENVDKAMARRVVDFLSGCVYALDGDVKKIAQSAYLFCPHNMDIVGDLETLQAEVESYI